MKDYIRERVLKEAAYIITTNGTCRKAGEKFYVSETTVFNDMKKRLPLLDQDMAKQIKEIFYIAKTEKHIRGGAAYKKNMEIARNRKRQEQFNKSRALEQ